MNILKIIQRVTIIFGTFWLVGCNAENVRNDLLPPTSTALPKITAASQSAATVRPTPTTIFTATPRPALTETPVAASPVVTQALAIDWSEAPPCENQPQDLATWLEYISNPKVAQHFARHVHHLQDLDTTFQNITLEELLVLLSLPQTVDTSNTILKELTVLWLNILSGRLNRATELEIPAHPEIRTVNDLLLNLEQALAEGKISETLLEASQSLQTGQNISRPICFRLVYRLGSVMRENGWATGGSLERDLSLADVPQGITSFSPDTTKLVVETARSDTGGGPLYLFDMQTQQLVNLNQQLDMADYGGPAGLTLGGWHPDSQHLLLIDQNNERVIWADVRANEYQRINLNPDPDTFVPLRQITLAPQGDYFVYVTGTPDHKAVINRYDFASQEITSLTTLEVHPAQVTSFRFSPVGDKAAYILKKGQRQAGVSYALELFDLTTYTSTPLVEGNLGRTEPVWSPDGQWIAFSRKSLDEPDVAGSAGSAWQGNIWLVSIDTGQVQQLTFVEGAASHPIWSANSRFIAFVTHSNEIGLVDVTQPGLMWRMGATIPYPQLTAISFIR